MPAPGEWSPFCVEEAEHLSRSASPTTGKRYGLQRVCRIFGLARSTASYLKARQAVPPERRPVPGKRGPVGAATDDDLVQHIRRVLAESPFHGEGYRKVWARLRHRGIRTAAERVRRLMREHHLRAPRRGGHAHHGSHHWHHRCAHRNLRRLPHSPLAGEPTQCERHHDRDSRRHRRHRPGLFHRPLIFSRIARSSRIPVRRGYPVDASFA